MSDGEQELAGPDLGAGVPLDDIRDGGMLAGHAQGKPVLVARRGDALFAIGAMCTHYGAPLADGILVNDTVRCPWHHACFDLRTGEALRAPALNPVATWQVEREGNIVRVTRERAVADGATPVGARVRDTSLHPRAIVIVGAGAAGNAAAEMLRRAGYAGTITMIGADESVPYDRPNLSKDYLAGSAPEEWIPLRPPEFYAGHDIELLRGTRVTAVNVNSRQVVLDGGAARTFDRLLIATGAEPVRLPIPGADLPHVYYLRTLADSRAIIARADHAHRAVVLGASFIGLETAAALRSRGLEVHVAAPESQPLERVMGPEVARFIRAVHERHGVAFHTGHVASRITPNAVALDDGTQVPAELVVIGAGVKPVTRLAEDAGLAMDRGIAVNEQLETSVPGIFAAGDVARFPDPRSGERIRVEHWVVAERQGQVAARNMLGARERFTAVPFFWSQHYDTTIRYVGHAERWDELAIDGNLDNTDATVTFRERGRTLAVATIGRDRGALEAEVKLERERSA